MKLQFVFSLCICLLLAGSLSAETTFIGVDRLWSNPNNWSDGLPDTTDKARIVDGADVLLVDFYAHCLHVVTEGGPTKFEIGAGGVLEMDDFFGVGFVGGSPDNRHICTVIDGGHIIANQRTHVGYVNGGAGLLVIDHDGILDQISQNIGCGQSATGDGIIELRGGELNLMGDTVLELAVGEQALGLLDLSGGVFTQTDTPDNLTRIEGYVAAGNITAYGGDGEVVIEQNDDGQIVMTGLHPLNPTPADSTHVVNGTITLSWIVDPGTAVDVWFGTLPDFISGLTKIVDKEVVTSVNVTTVAKQRYFWAVDTYAPGADIPDLGPIFDFYADNIAPDVDAGDDVTTWLDNGGADVSLAGTVTDIDTTTTLWTVVSEPDDPNSPDAVIADPAALDTTITLSAVGEYVLQLEADDGEYTGTDTMTINVYSDSCEAAKSQPDFELIPGDINEDCIVNDLDLFILMENWLRCNALGCTDPEHIHD